jgi:predicted HTH domain antitoxin
MNIVVPDELLRGTRFDSDRAVLDLAIGLYADDRVTLGQAAAIAAMSQALFLRELGRLHVPMHYDVEDFAADLAVLEQL